MYEIYKQQLSENGFTVIEQVFSADVVNELISLIDNTDTNHPLFRKTADLFAIRRFLNVIPEASPIIFNQQLKNIIHTLFGSDYFTVKSIYFDKPGNSNWFVAWHQDLTISVDQKTEIPGYGPWTVKPDQYAVQPPVDLLENIYTIRIHLDDTTTQNGALKVIPGSHKKGIIRPSSIDLQNTPEVSCEVAKGGIMIMQPLLLHASSRSTNNQNRRVVHIELSNQDLPAGINWAEKL
ncbi:phytanoyl-CoA dioxygenase [Chitinophaga silvatica]|uniref:Phytanoyl-CoA dioxygenase n=1 Tax=Chitinophaga silvatica TaxID=2282649 RepID=A0A3E1Y2G8_9BACT|nr:phytanoyl-CoA dioxygenase family protein [Chitinophaga silvatica]RFS18816.1 phytanoyl-CoA dioxygenase [Chitinophaga silvatica]